VASEASLNLSEIMDSAVRRRIAAASGQVRDCFGAFAEPGRTVKQRNAELAQTRESPPCHRHCCADVQRLSVGRTTRIFRAFEELSHELLCCSRGCRHCIARSTRGGSGGECVKKCCTQQWRQRLCDTCQRIEGRTSLSPLPARAEA